MKITVDKKFIMQRNKRAKLYNPGKRSKEQLLRDIECELYEYEMIKKGRWQDADIWQVDGYAFHGAIDVKCIKAYYNVSRKKLVNLIKQREYIDYYHFIEWKSRPDRLLKTGDVVEFNHLGEIKYNDLLDNLKISFKTEGFYVDVRKIPEVVKYELLRNEV